MNEITKEYHSEVAEEIRAEITPQLRQLIRRRMNLAARIDDVLQARGLTNAEFAFMMGKKPSEISRWLSGTHNFTTETLWEIERVLNIQLLVSSPMEPEAAKERAELKEFIGNEVEKALEKYFARKNLALH
jgi:transcriptional regulator with XRE-family HTH domain